MFDSIKKLTKFEKSLKLINIGPCRGLLADSKFSSNEDEREETYTNRNSCKITFIPAIHNLVVFYSTVETTKANTSERGSWFVEKYCDCLNQTEEKPLLTFLSMMQKIVHIASRTMTNLKTGDSLGQTPEVKMFTQDREFFISKTMIDPVTYQSTDGEMVKPGSNTTNSETFAWKTDEGQNIRGRNAFILFEQHGTLVQELVKSVRNLEFDTRSFQLNKRSLDSYLKICCELEHDVGCILTCIFGELTENDAKEVCILVDQKEMPITDILHSFVGPKNAQWIGKPKIIVLINQEALECDAHLPEKMLKLDISATNHSGWLVLILKDNEFLEKLIGIFKCEDLKNGKSLQELLYPLLITESKKNTVLLNSTLQYLLDFPVWPRTFVSQSFSLRVNDSSTVNIIEFDEIVKEAKKSFEKGQVWLMSSVAGAGKTTVLKEITYQLGKSNPDLKILYISLKKHSFTIWKISRLNQFLAKATNHSTDDIKLWIEEKRAVVFFDGFDEICPDLCENVITFFHTLKEQQVPMFIATRPHEAEIIQERINCEVLLGVDPLNEEKQIEFLKIVAGKNEKECKQFIQDFEEKDILENPLHLSLIASSKSEGNLYQIYAKVVETKLELCLVRDGFDINNKGIFSLKMHMASNHLQLIALRFLRNESLIGLGIREGDLEKINDYGVATVLDGEVSFLHQTFAEFLATKQFLENFDSSQALDSVLFQDSTSAQCRKFLDLFYCILEKEEAEDLIDHTEALLAIAKSIGPVIFLEKVIEDNLRQVFRMVKPRISFHADSNASICIETSPELLMRAIGKEEIAIQLLEMGVLDKTGLEQNLPDLLRKIEENNAVNILEKLRLEFSDLQGMIGAYYSKDTETSKRSMKVGFAAIRNDFAKLLEILIQSGIRAVDAFEEEENSLFTACKHGSVKCFRVLLKHGARRVYYASTQHDPLNVATEFGHLDLVKVLLEENSSIFKRDESTLVLDGLQDIWNPFQYAIMYGRKDIAEYLLSKCPTSNDIRTKDGKTLMHLAVLMRKWEVLEWLAQLPDTDINYLNPDTGRKFWTQFELENYEHFLMLQGEVKEKDEKGRSVLHYAAKYGYTDLVAKFIKAGADIDAKDAKGWNALHYACLVDKNIETIKLLHSRSKHLAKTITKEGQTALHIMVEYCDQHDFGRAISRNVDIARFLVEDAEINLSVTDDQRKNAARIAVERGLEKSLTMYLRAQYINPSAKNDLKKSPVSLYLSAAGELVSLQQWIQQGGDLSMRDECGRTALQLTEEIGKFRLFQKKTGLNEQFEERNSEGSLLLACIQKNWGKAKNLLSTKNLSINRQDKDGKTALHYAAEEGNLGIAQQLLSQRANVLLKDHNGWTALHYAILTNNQVLVQKLIESGADIDSKTKRGETALHLTAYKGYTELTQKLIDCGANVNLKNNHGLTCLNFATVNRDQDLLKILLKNNAHVNAESQFFGQTALHHAAIQNYPEILEMLVDHDADVNLKDKKGWTALHIAALYYPELSQKLLDHGADVNSKELEGWTSLHIAARYNPELCQKLLDHGADVNLKTKFGWTALHFASRYNTKLLQKLLYYGANMNVKDKDGWTPLHLTTSYNPKSVNMLLDHGADVDSKLQNGWTALHLAIDLNRPASVLELLVKGADVNLKNVAGCTALQLAKAQNNRALEDMLLDQSICNGLNSTTATIDALQLAIASNNFKVAEDLINNYGDLTVQDKNGKNILQHALKNFEMVKYLHEKNGELVKQVTNDGSTNLHLAIDNDDCPFEVIQWLIEEIKIDVDATNQFGETAFMIACKRNRSDVVEYLLANKGIDLSIEDRGGRTALHYAVRSLSVDLVQKLLDLGADLTKKDNDNRNVMFYGLKSMDMILCLKRKNMEFVLEVDWRQTTLLLYAIIDSMIKRDVVNWLIEESGIDLNAADIDGNSAIIFACKKRKWDIVETLLTKDVNIQVKDEGGKSLLHHAAESGNLDLVQKLIELGVNPSLKDNLGKNTLHYALQHLDVVKSLDRALVKEVTKDKNTSLHLAIGMYEYSIEVIQWLLDEAQVDVNAVNGNGETALMTACSKNRFEVIRILLEKKADVSIRDNNRRTALHHAARSGHLDLIKLLFDHMTMKEVEDGSSDIQVALVEHLKQVDKKDNTLLILAMKSSKKIDEKVISWLVEGIKLDLNAVNSNGESALLLACKQRKWDAVNILLSREDTDIGSKDQTERTPLHWAAASGNLDVVQRLVERGADLTLKDSDGMNVMHHALKDIETVKFLHNLNKGLVTEITKNGSTCLHLAVIRGSTEAIRWLVDEEIEVDLDKSNELGLTALLLACRRNMWEVVELLVDNNVDISKPDRAGKTALKYAEESEQFELMEKLCVLSDTEMI
ncbi:uncharacterized protein LOC135941815 [Cloeon dipterum]|uniref:uncharacterized protein LOC135941815 n=1 Tax=Cloeon dipterum TaxID=197152 RepID=UPI00321F92AD